MCDLGKTRQQLIDENERLRRQLAAQEDAAAEDLRHSHDELQAIYDNMVDGLLIADCSSGKLVRANPAICRMLGYSPEELLAMSVADIHPPEIVPDVLEKFHRQQEGQRLVTRNRPMLRNDGTVFYADISNVRIAWQGRPCIIGVFRDITERKQVEEALRASEERYELAVRGAGVGIFDWNILTNKVYYSPRWKALFGYSENEIGDSVEDWARLLHPDDWDPNARQRDAFFAGTETTTSAEYRLRHKDGSYRWVEAHLLVVRDESGRPCRLVGSHGDITERKQAQEALQRERQSLWQMLQASDHDRRMIAYEIHDGLAQYLAAAGMRFQAYEALRKVSPREARRAYKTAVELMRQAHAETRRLISEVRPPVIDEIGLETAISHLVHEQRRRAKPKIEFHSNVQFHRLPSILENSLYRIVQEALTNAVKHSRAKTVTVTLAQHGPELTLEVRDSGVGFDPQTVEKGHYGLEGIRQRVRLLGGRLTLQTAPGAGTLVQAVVPILETTQESSPPPSDQA